MEVCGKRAETAADTSRDLKKKEERMELRITNPQENWTYRADPVEQRGIKGCDCREGKGLQDDCLHRRFAQRYESRPGGSEQVKESF
mgnify:CR=1 FL=1